MRFNHGPHEPAVYDTNVWVFGLTEQLAACSNLVDAVINDSQRVIVPAYVFEEVRLTFESGRVDSDVAEDQVTDFATMLHGNVNINGPSQAAIQTMDVQMVRNSAAAQAFGPATNTQPKDAPVLWNAYQAAQGGREVTIYTTDKDFSNCSPPPIAGDGSVMMEHID